MITSLLFFVSDVGFHFSGFLDNHQKINDQQPATSDDVTCDIDSHQLSGFKDQRSVFFYYYYYSIILEYVCVFNKTNF